MYRTLKMVRDHRGNYLPSFLNPLYITYTTGLNYAKEIFIGFLYLTICISNGKIFIDKDCRPFDIITFFYDKRKSYNIFVG